MRDRIGDARQEGPADEELAERVLSGDQAAFSLLYKRYAPQLARHLRRVLRRPSDVEDALQTTFLQVYRSLARRQEGKSFSAWMHGIAFNVAGTRLRSRKRRWWQWSASDHEERWTPSEPPPTSEDEVIRRQLREQLAQALQCLPPKKHMALVLHELEGLGHTEIGELLDASPQTIWARVKSARSMLRQEFERLQTEGAVHGGEP